HGCQQPPSWLPKALGLPELIFQTIASLAERLVTLTVLAAFCRAPGALSGSTPSACWACAVPHVTVCGCRSPSRPSFGPGRGSLSKGAFRSCPKEWCSWAGARTLAKRAPCLAPERASGLAGVTGDFRVRVGLRHQLLTKDTTDDRRDDEPALAG